MKTLAFCCFRTNKATAASGFNSSTVQTPRKSRCPRLGRRPAARRTPPCPTAGSRRSASRRWARASIAAAYLWTPSCETRRRCSARRILTPARSIGAACSASASSASWFGSSSHTLVARPCAVATALRARAMATKAARLVRMPQSTATPCAENELNGAEPARRCVRACRHLQAEDNGDRLGDFGELAVRLLQRLAELDQEGRGKQQDIGGLEQREEEDGMQEEGRVVAQHPRQSRHICAGQRSCAQRPCADAMPGVHCTRAKALTKEPR
jgi:hypothetical protein